MMMNLTKTVIMLKVVQSLAPLGPSYAPVARLVAADEAGRDWEIEESPAPVPNGARAAIAERLTGAVLLPALDAMGRALSAPPTSTAARAMRCGSSALRWCCETPEEVERLVATIREERR